MRRVYQIVGTKYQYFNGNKTTPQTDFPANLTQQHHYLMAPHGGAYDMNVGNANRNELTEEEADSEITTDSDEESLKLKDAPAAVLSQHQVTFLYSCYACILYSSVRQIL